MARNPGDLPGDIYPDVIYSFKDLQVDFPAGGGNLTDVFLWNTNHASVFVQSTKPQKS